MNPSVSNSSRESMEPRSCPRSRDVTERTRRTITRALASCVAAFLTLSGATRCLAMIGNATIAIENTNVVISWPSEGYEYYLIQSRPSLDPSTPWTTLTNLYPANGTNDTTFTIPGVVAPPASGGEGGGSGDPPSPLESTGQQWELTSSIPMVMQKGGAGSPVPLNLYPPGVDLSGYLIIWPDGSIDEWSPKLSEAYALLQAEATGGAQTESGSESITECAFFRIFHVPD